MKRVGPAMLAGAILFVLWLWLAHARLDRAHAGYAEAVAASRPAGVTATRLLPARDPAAAQRALARLLGDAASTATVRLTVSPLPARLDGLATARIEAVGREDRLRAFIEAAEAPPSPLRLTRWSIAGDGAGALRLSAEAAAPWPGHPTASATRLADAAPAQRAPARTLFALDAPTDARPATAETPPELIGIAGRLPDDAIALVRLPDGRIRNLRIGEGANGWRLAAISADRVRFTRGSEQRDLVLPPRE